MSTLGLAFSYPLSNPDNNGRIVMFILSFQLADSSSAMAILLFLLSIVDFISTIIFEITNISILFLLIISCLIHIANIFFYLLKCMCFGYFKVLVVLF